MLAAIDVMLGHFLHVKHARLENYTHSHLLAQTLSLGGFSVALFFGLSGIALYYQTREYGSGLVWISGRLMRLMPMYWITLILPIVGYALLGYSLNYPKLGYILALLGLNSLSFSANIGIPPINNPLWTLSVEIVLSLSLLLFAKLPKTLLKVVLLTTLISSSLWTGNALLQATTVFVFGYLLPQVDLLIIKHSKIHIFLFIYALLVLFLAPGLLLGGIQNRVIGFLFQTSVVCSLLIFLVVNPKISRNWVSDFSQRSYSLYAAHFPVILLVNKVLFKRETALGWAQILVSLLLIAATTEVLHKLVDVPSIKSSRKFLKAKSKQT